MNKKISENVIKRLPKYYRFLSELFEANIKRISSIEISKSLRLTASQVRQDLFNFGCFGQQGYGYDVEFLKNSIGEILCLNHTHTMVVVGGGRIGQALANYRTFFQEGFKMKAVFDVELSTIFVHEEVEVLHVDDLEEYLKTTTIDIGVIATQKDVAQEIGNRLVACGIKSIWNFAPCDLYFGEDVAVENINMSESLFRLAFKMHHL